MSSLIKSHISQELLVHSEISSLASTSSKDQFLQKVEELLFLNAAHMECQRFKLSESKSNEMYELSFRARLERAEKRRYVGQDAESKCKKYNKII
ncbi:hypothetical protein PNEG_03321 [Pneumocystis murina B123]|uniref:Uncharacterized protein n=1 Tax=Pneumocystis murina (strain B123) TaxID=1069680 RepID=M7P3Q9_PNEMU|nr:hypothetical protein PNEG_03321 [Pneumocystis murina B123]EMR08495.1 hypothetical protein PNEG_03321 [Pneumocystis murina B123]